MIAATQQSAGLQRRTVLGDEPGRSRAESITADRSRRMKLLFRAAEDARASGQADEAERLLAQWRALSAIQKREVRCA